MEMDFRQAHIAMQFKKLGAGTLLAFWNLFVWSFCFASSWLFSGCDRRPAQAQDVSSYRDVSSGAVSNRSASQFGNESDDVEIRAELHGALERAARAREERMQGVPLPPSQFPFPNFHAGPHLPNPIGVNFYSMNDRYTNYLLCAYDVRENHYDKSNEPAWLESALLQVRASGPDKFPPIKWVAVIILNRAEMTNAETVDESHKVGAIFNASDVFSFDKRAQELVGFAQLDRHPFHLDLAQPTPVEKDRWMIVERHVASNHATAVMN